MGVAIERRESAGTLWMQVIAGGRSRLTYLLRFSVVRLYELGEAKAVQVIPVEIFVDRGQLAGTHQLHIVHVRVCSPNA